jgi:hypothetical protein
VLLVLAAVLSTATLHRVCDAIFACGCTWLFTGAAAHCNIHAPQPPHCPACTRLVPGALLAFSLFGAWTGLLHLVARRRD